MSLPAEMAAFIAEQRGVGSSGLKGVGQDLSQGPRAGRIFRRAGLALKGTSVPGSGAMSDPEILGGWVDMVTGVTEAVATGVASLVVGATEGVSADILPEVIDAKRRISKA